MLEQALTEDEAGAHFGTLLMMMTCAVALGDSVRAAAIETRIADDAMLVDAGIDPRGEVLDAP